MGKRSHSGHRHHHGLKHWLRRWRRHHMRAMITLAVMVLFMVGLGAWMLANYRGMSRFAVLSQQDVPSSEDYREVAYRGKRYRYNRRLTTLLYAGIDSFDPIESKTAYTSAPRADSIALVLLDSRNQKLSILALNRDTMTDIHKYTVDGKDRGTFTDHLAMAFAYGDGGEVSCENLCRAVSDLLFGVPVDGYIASNRASLPFIGKALGPVEVTVPNDDLAEQGFKAGDLAVVDDTNIELFLRSRDTGVDLSNTGRMDRQRAYIAGAMDKVTSLLTRDVDAGWQLMERSENSVTTDITRNRYLDLIRILKNVKYTIQIFNYGNCKRDFTYIDDIIEGVVRVMGGAPEKKVGEDGLLLPPYAVYNIGGGTPENLLDYIRMLQEELVWAGVLPKDYDFVSRRELVGQAAGQCACDLCGL